METAKPTVAILMAVYEPRLEWLGEQLESLNAQSYRPLRLYIQDDCSPTVPFGEIEACVKAHIRAFPWTLARNGKNLGSNLTFQHLTQRAEGDYFAYCDQDDVWLPEKLGVLAAELERTGAQLACSDMYIIDGAGRGVADSITAIRRHHVFRSGEGLTDTLWYSNFASGCALLVRGETAKAAVPFDPYMYYDHYITLFAANRGAIAFVNRPLLRHREHGDNQSSTMRGIVDKESYRALRVETPRRAVEWLCENFPADETLRRTLEEGRAWLTARENYLRGERNCGGTVWRYRRYSPMASLFELALPWLPMPLFRLAIWASKRNYI